MPAPDVRSSLTASLAELHLRLAADTRRARRLRPVPSEVRSARAEVHAAVLEARAAGVVPLGVRAEIVILDECGEWSWVIAVTSPGPLGGRAVRVLSMRWACEFAPDESAEAAA